MSENLPNFHKVNILGDQDPKTWILSAQIPPRHYQSLSPPSKPLSWLPTAYSCMTELYSIFSSGGIWLLQLNTDFFFWGVSTVCVPMAYFQCCVTPFHCNLFIHSSIHEHLDCLHFFGFYKQSCYKHSCAFWGAFTLK